MSKTKSLITEAAARAASSSLITKAWDKLEKEAEAVVKASERPNTEVRIISANGRTQTHVRTQGVEVLLDGNAMAVRLSDEKKT